MGHDIRGQRRCRYVAVRLSVHSLVFLFARVVPLDVVFQRRGMEAVSTARVAPPDAVSPSLSGNLPITFWESTTSQRFVHKCSAPLTRLSLASSFFRRYGAKAVAHKYSRVHCVFNAHNLWANVARDDSVAATAFELHNPAAWKAMDASVVAQVFRNRAPCIKPSTINVADIERRCVRRSAPSPRCCLSPHYCRALANAHCPLPLQPRVGRHQGPFPPPLIARHDVYSRRATRLPAVPRSRCL